MWLQRSMIETKSKFKNYGFQFSAAESIVQLEQYLSWPNPMFWDFIQFTTAIERFRAKEKKITMNVCLHFWSSISFGTMGEEGGDKSKDTDMSDPLPPLPEISDEMFARMVQVSLQCFILVEPFIICFFEMSKGESTKTPQWCRRAATTSSGAAEAGQRGW